MFRHRLWTSLGLSFVLLAIITVSTNAQPREKILVRNGVRYLGYYYPDQSRFVSCRQDVYLVVQPPDSIRRAIDRCESRAAALDTYVGQVIEIDGLAITIRRSNGEVVESKLPSDSLLTFSRFMLGDTVAIARVRFPTSHTSVTVNVGPPALHPYWASRSIPQYRPR